MIEHFRNDTGIFLARLHGLRKRREQHNFKGMFSNARSALFILPKEDGQSTVVLEVLRKVQQQFQGNALTIVTHGPSGTLSGKLNQCTIIPVRDEEINIFFLPKKNIIKRLRERQYDVIVDLNLNVTPLAAFICAAIDAPLKAGFVSLRSDAVYNFQLQAVAEREPALRFEGLLNTLSMF